MEYFSRLDCSCKFITASNGFILQSALDADVLFVDNALTIGRENARQQQSACNGIAKPWSPATTSYRRHGQAVPRAGCRTYRTGSIHGWRRSHLPCIPGGCQLKERKITSQSNSITVEFSVQCSLETITVQYNLGITSVIAVVP